MLCPRNTHYYELGPPSSPPPPPMLISYNFNHKIVLSTHSQKTGSSHLTLINITHRSISSNLFIQTYNKILLRTIWVAILCNLTLFSLSKDQFYWTGCLEKVALFFNGVTRRSIVCMLFLCRYCISHYFRVQLFSRFWTRCGNSRVVNFAIFLKSSLL